jgi:hypothetical protein
MPKNHVAFLLAVAMSVFLPQKVQAGCEFSLTNTVSTGYLLQDLGKRASNRPGLATMVLGACPVGSDTLVFDVWNRLDAGGFKPKNFGNETDLEFAYDTNVGPIAAEFYAAYFDLAPRALRNGAIELYADFGYPSDFGWVKIKPAIRPIQIIGIGGISDFTILRLRMPITFPLDHLQEGLSLTVEPSVSHNFTPQPGQARYSFRPEASLNYDVNQSLRLSLIGKSANGHTVGEFALRIKF